MAAGARTCDWSPAVKDYLSQAESIISGKANGTSMDVAPAPTAEPPLPVGGPVAGGAVFGASGGSAPPAGGLFGAAADPAKPSPFGAGAFGGAAPVAPSLFGGAAPVPPPLFGGAPPAFGATAPAPAPAPAPAAPPPAAPPPAAPTGGGGADGDADVKFSKVTKLSVYRQEKRNEEGEVMSDAGWKAIGRGQLRVMAVEGVHFVEFRPEVIEGGGGQEPEEEMAGKVRFGRPVLSAKLRADTKFEANKKSVQVNLWSADAAGTAVYARYNMPMGAEEAATSFAAMGMACLPAA